MRASFLRFIPIPAALGLLFLACSDPPPPANPDAELLPLKVSTAKPAETVEATPTPTAEPTAAPTAAPTATASAPPTSQGSGRPPVLKMDPNEISDTFGVSPGAKLELGTEESMAILRIPEGAFETGVNVTFKIDKKGKTTGILVGQIYRLTAVIPPAGEPSKVATAAGPFELQLPAGAKKDANLAIGEIGPGKVTWKVIAPIKIDDVTSTAYYELKELHDYYLHVTTKAVTAPAK